MYAAKFTVCLAERIASSITGKYASPFCSSSILLPPMGTGLLRARAGRKELGELTAKLCRIRYSSASRRMKKRQKIRTSPRKASAEPIHSPMVNFPFLAPSHSEVLRRFASLLSMRR
jgi:hypothetical protein